MFASCCIYFCEGKPICQQKNCAAAQTLPKALRKATFLLMSEKYIRVLRSLLPEAMLRRLELDPERLDRLAERRWVTVLFADISGFTPLCERLDPEEVMELVNLLFERLSRCVRRHGGTVDKFLGDALMAVFGAPVSHSDDPHRAVRAALEMLAATEEFNRSAKARRAGAKLSISIGINTGFVVSGFVGDDTHREYTVFGDGVNTAARLEQSAPAGEILVGSETYEATKRSFRFERVGSLALRGKTRPEEVWRVVGAEPPITLDEDEKIIIHDEQTAAFITENLGRGDHFAVKTDPTAADYWRRWLLANFGGEVVVAEPVPGRGFGVVEAIVGSLPGGKLEREEFIAQAAKALEEALGNRCLVVFRSERCDDGSAAVLQKLEGKAVLWLGEDAPSFVARTHTQRKLSKVGVARAAKAFFGAKRISRKAAQTLWSTTHGERGHLLHLLRYLRRRNAVFEKRGVLTISGDAAIPGNTSAYAMEYLDSLPPRLREDVVKASVLGERFPADVLRELLGRVPQEVFEVEGSWARFRFWLLQRVAYESLTSPVRRRLHSLAARAYKRAAVAKELAVPPQILGKYGVRRAKKELAESRLEEFAPELALHCELAGRWREAFRYLVAAGEQQRRRWSYHEALGYFERASRIGMRMVKRWRNHSQLADILFTAGELAFVLGRYNDALRFNRAAARLGKEAEKPEILFGALVRMAVIFNETGKFVAADALYSAALRILETLPTSRERERRRAQVLLNLGTLRAQLGELDRAKGLLKKALSLARSTDDAQMTSQALTNLGWIFERTGRLRRAERLYLLALRIDTDRGDIIGQAQTLVNLANTKRALGELDAAVKMLRKAMRLFEKVGDFAGIAVAANNLGEFLRELGEAERALKLHIRARRMAKRIGDPFLQADCAKNLASDYAALGENAKALREFSKAQKLFRKLGEEDEADEIAKRISELAAQG